MSENDVTLIGDLILALEGCTKFSSDADFEHLGALVYRNRKVILDALNRQLDIKELMKYVEVVQ
jgi:hypothetical protein